MKKNLVVFSLAAMTALVVSACAADQGEDPSAAPEGENVDTTEEALTNAKLYGSDTLKTAIVVETTKATPKPQPAYQGKGSGIGEGCLRDPAKSGGGFCGTGTSAYQSLAPMSRAFKNTGANTCSGGATSPNTTTGCCANERTNVIALDGVNLYVDAQSNQANITSASAKDLFAGDANGTATTFPTGCPTAVTGYNLAQRYRRNDASGTTDTFKSLLGIADTKDFHSFCPDVVSVDDAVSSAVKPVGTKRNPTTGAPINVPLTACANGDDATTCIGKLTVVSGTGTVTSTPVGYAGDPAQNANNKKLTVDSIASNATNIRHLLTNTAPVYPLARRVYLNENTVTASATEETNFYRWIYGTDANGTGNHKSTFEADLVAQGFISCSSGGALQCGTGVCKNSSGVAINDGRGTNVSIGGVNVACKAATRCVR